jgi:hypothetical protein
MLVLGVVSGEGAVVQKKLGLAFCGKRLGADWLGGTVSEDRHLHWCFLLVPLYPFTYTSTLPLLIAIMGKVAAYYTLPCATVPCKIPEEIASQDDSTFHPNTTAHSIEAPPHIDRNLSANGTVYPSHR